jgi:hypothetical protein
VLSFLTLTHNKYLLSQLKTTNSIAMISHKKLNSLAGFEPGPSALESDATSTKPRRYAIRSFFCQQNAGAIPV